jgi:hypothetical protein
MGAHVNLDSWNFQPKPNQNPHPIAVRPKPTQTQQAVAVPLLHSTPVDITYSRVFVKICRPTQAHPWIPELTQKQPLTQWVWVGRGFGWAGFEIPVSGVHCHTATK